MPLNVIRATDPMPVEHINILIFGIPGIGKTSIAYSADHALLLDFDKGAHRSGFRGDTQPIASWRDAVGLTVDELKPYNTIILDTVGRALDHLTRQIQDDNPKYRTANGNLTLQGWGELKGAFIGWMNQLRLMGKDVVMLAHDKENQRDEITVVRPDIQGGSYAEIFKIADSVAYFGPGGEHGHGILTFDPKPEHSGKNPGQIPPIDVPHLIKEPKFLAGVITDIKDKLGAIGERGRQIAAAVEEYREDIEGAKSMKKINELADMSQDIADRPVMAAVKHLINNRAKQLGLMYSKKAGKFVKNPDAEGKAEEPEEKVDE